jgi:hypothetical protein
MDNENVPYRARMNSLPGVATPSTVRGLLADGIAQLNGFNAFDLVESELKIKQQIKAHQLAYDILAPLLETIDNTITQINSKHRSK